MEGSAFPWGKVARAKPVTDEGNGLGHRVLTLKEGIGTTSFLFKRTGPFGVPLIRPLRGHLPPDRGKAKAKPSTRRGEGGTRSVTDEGM